MGGNDTGEKGNTQGRVGMIVTDRHWVDTKK